jgi:hypothetical protein
MSAEHEHYEEKENTEPDNVNVGLITTITVVGAVLVVSIALALTALVRSEAAEHGSAVGAYADLGTVSRLKATQTERLQAPPGWADEAKRFVALPIGRAMDLTTADIQSNPALATKWSPADEPEAEPDGGAAEPAEAEKPEAPGGKPDPEGAKGDVAPEGSQGDTAEQRKQRHEPAPDGMGATPPGTPGPSESGQ